MYQNKMTINYGVNQLQILSLFTHNKIGHSSRSSSNNQRSKKTADQRCLLITILENGQKTNRQTKRKKKTEKETKRKKFKKKIENRKKTRRQKEKKVKRKKEKKTRRQKEKKRKRQID